MPSPNILYSKLVPGSNKKVISFSVYGTKNVYLLGAERNIDIAKEIYPDWICRFYCSKDISNLENLKRFAEQGLCEVIVVDSPIFPMYWRYFAADDPNISYVSFRDTDSLVNYRELAAVQDWLNSDKTLHTMHDADGGHWSPVMGGMCGLKLPIKINMHDAINDWCILKNKNYRFNYSQDQSFLSEKILPMYEHSQIDHHKSYKVSKWKNSVPFPDHQPITFGNFVGDRISAFALVSDSYRSIISNEVYLVPHLGPNDCFTIKNLVSELTNHYENVIIPYKQASEKNIQSLFGGNPKVTLVLIKDDDEAFNLYISKYSSFKFIGLGCHSTHKLGYGWGEDSAFKQAEIPRPNPLPEFIARPSLDFNTKDLPRDFTQLTKKKFNNSSKASTTSIEISEKNPLISVVIPTYNRFNYLLNAIKSVYNQTYKNFEIIVVNDHSTESDYYNFNFEDEFDNKLNIVHLPKNSRSIHKDKKSVCGGGDSRNIGIMMSSGHYISCLDDDDSFLPSKLEKQVNAVQEYNVQISCTEALYGTGPINPDVSYKNWHYNGVFWSSLKKIFSGNRSKMLESMYEKDYNIWTKDYINIHNTTCGGSSMFFDKSLFYKVGYFRIMGQGEDWYYWKKLMEHSDCIFIREPLTYIDAHHANGQHWL